MPSEDLIARLAREPVRVECPICRHRQNLAAPEGRCDQCGSELAIFTGREAAQRKLDELIADGRVAYLSELQNDLFAVVANRSFRKRV
jgi:ribosomal protein S27E